MGVAGRMRSGGTRGIKREREKLPRQTRSSRPHGRPRRDAHGPARDAAAVPVPVPASPPPSRARLRDPGAGPRSPWGCAAGYGAPAAAARAGAWRSPRGPRRSRWSVVTIRIPPLERLWRGMMRRIYGACLMTCPTQRRMTIGSCII